MKKIDREDEKIYWPGYLEHISLFILGRQLTFNLGQSEVAENLCRVLKMQKLNPFQSNQNDSQDKTVVENLQ